MGLLTERQIRRGSHASVWQLKTAIQEFLDVSNEGPKPFVWTKSPDTILASIARFCYGHDGGSWRVIYARIQWLNTLAWILKGYG